MLISFKNKTQDKFYQRNDKYLERYHLQNGGGFQLNLGLDCNVFVNHDPVMTLTSFMGRSS